MDRPVLDLTWDYPVKGPLEEPDAEAVLAEINGWDSDGEPLSRYTQLKDDGSTTCGCWIYCGVYAGGVNQAARRKPGGEQNWVANRVGLGLAGEPAGAVQPGLGGPGRPAVERAQGPGLVGRREQPLDRARRARLHRRPAAGLHAARGATGVAAIAGTDPFIMQADGKAWLFAPAGLVDGPLPTHYEPQESPFANLLYGQQHNPVRQIISHPQSLYQPSGNEPGSRCSRTWPPPTG